MFNDLSAAALLVFCGLNISEHKFYPPAKKIPKGPFATGGDVTS
jgi:hypothetical protein